MTSLYRCQFYLQQMLKTYQFKTHCKGDIHSKTAYVILPGLMTKCRSMPLPVNRFQIQVYGIWMLVETTHVTEFEY